MPPAWLQTLFEKWRAARGDRLAPAKNPFSTPWPELLEDAGLKRVEDLRAAEHDLKQLHDQGRLKRVTHDYRLYLILRVQIPIEAESWLQETFGHRPASDRHAQSLLTVKEFEAKHHPRFPELWQQWCGRIYKTFEQGLNIPPLMWKAPEKVRELLDLTFRFTSVVWAENTPVRTASIALGLEGGSKGLEPRKANLESCLNSLFGRPVTLESCGIQLTEPKADVAGQITLHSSDEKDIIHAMKGVVSLSLKPDIEQAISISTPAAQILLVENKKTTLPQLALKNKAGGTLLIGCSFPNSAVLRLLELLPPDLPVYHFGDTDPAGFLILAKLREQTGRSIHPFLMQHRRGSAAIALTEYDRKILPGLLENPWLDDVRAELESIAFSQDKGLYEQENQGQPDLHEWPFYSSLTSDPTAPSQPAQQP